ncbi:MAG: 1-(5-phosphoribosyl)-5-[(5-phosphoribosylamino)methylideneamino]imidazole-4-carboxamide isomerase [Hyphomonadaceae bacterium]|nr:1-(5-phosphoribosyl)-5-[(5-phosphoribosylamino)methylideneamino]imidazole-4-carboxamide isomerase [Hyphomonadaceae bacterium]
MLIFPAIDLQKGVCVRLLRGAFDSATQYGDPAETLRGFAQAGASWVHIVDLDGARVGAPAQHALIGALACSEAIKVQCGGGVRERAHVEALLEAGVARVVVGSAAVRRPAEVAQWIEEFGVERICVALDVRAAGDGWEVATEGWTQGAGRSLDDALSFYPAGRVRHALVTDISRDGALTGSNVALMQSLAQKRPDIAFQASGGVATLDDLRAVKQAGASGVIIGRALYERRFTLEDALAI